MSKCFLDYNFVNEYNSILAESEQWARQQATMPKKMRSFEDSMKSKKTVASMIERKGDEKDVKKSVKIVDIKEETVDDRNDDQVDKEDQILANRRKLAEKLSKKKVDTK